MPLPTFCKSEKCVGGSGKKIKNKKGVPFSISLQREGAHLALLCEDLFEVQPPFSPHVAVGDVSKLRGGVTFGADILCRPDVVQRLKHLDILL